MDARGGLDVALLFEVNAGELAWSFKFVSWAEHPLLQRVRHAILEVGRAFDHHCSLWKPQFGVRTALGVTPSNVEVPTIPYYLPGMCLVLKPPGWEVDTEGNSGLRHLSVFLQVALPADRRSVAFRSDFSFGFIHRLDTPSSGLILTATSFEGYSCLEWQMYTYNIAREYNVMGHDVAKTVELDVVKRILDTKTAVVAENGRPAQSHIRFLASVQLQHLENGRALFCMVSIRIFTGRRHQIRVHMQHSGCASVADSRYNPSPEILVDGCWSQVTSRC